jgi:uncharacterized protein (DUF362 family)
MTDPVAIVKGEDPSKMVQTALQLIKARDQINPEDSVLIKPNYVRAKPPSTGITTDSRVIESIIKCVKTTGVKDENIVVGEGGAGDTEKAFDTVGIREVPARHHVRLVNLNRDSRINIKVPQALALNEVGVAETAINSSCIINVPTLKVHSMAVVTLCMKNLMGLILPKNIMHNQVHEKIVDLTSLFMTKVKINVIDGLVGSELHETNGTPIKSGLIIAGHNMVAVDTVATAAMGIKPCKVKYLDLAEKIGLGVKLEEIAILGEKIDQVMKQFRI